MGTTKVKMTLPATFGVISAKNKLVEVSSISFIAGLSASLTFSKESIGWLPPDPEEQCHDGAMVEEGVWISTSRQ